MFSSTISILLIPDNAQSTFLFAKTNFIASSALLLTWMPAFLAKSGVIPAILPPATGPITTTPNPLDFAYAIASSLLLSRKLYWHRTVSKAPVSASIFSASGLSWKENEMCLISPSSFAFIASCNSPLPISDSSYPFQFNPWKW